MKKSIPKILLGILIILSLVAPQALLVTQVHAAPLNWSNPNQNGNNPYKLSVGNVINSGLLTSLVGCTGLVQKVSKLTIGLVDTIAKGLGLVKGFVDKPVTTKDDDAKKEQEKITQKLKEAAFREECINGIAVRLARNQLTAMTRNTLSWVTSGFNGDPLYVRDVNSYMDSLTRDILDKENALLKDPKRTVDYPYGRDYARSQIESYKQGKNKLTFLKQDLTNYLEPGSTPSSFATDFSQGGWDGWIALTSKPQNNPLGFSITAGDDLANKQSTVVSNTKSEIDRNGGYVDQKKCAEYAKANPDDDPSSYQNPDGSPKCLKYETVTPGSLIKSKVEKALNSPETQLELVKTLNDALNALFSALIDKFHTGGLSGLSPNKFTTPVSGGFGSNSIVDSTGTTISIGGDSITGATGSGVDGAFDLTKDLGNIYVKATDNGSWDAQNNIPELIAKVGEKNHFYTITKGGNTNITPDVTRWNVGDKAFFDGETWIKGVPKYVIEKRGMLQIQQDYIDQALKAQEVLPEVLSSIGELDYCIPGPNPSWKDSFQETLDSVVAEQVNLTIPHQTPDQAEKYWTETGNAMSLEYETKIDALYGESSPMQTQFLPDGSDNPSYLAVAPVALNITKNLPSYASAVEKSFDTYKSDITQTQVNIYKLNKLKGKINTIIAAAQQRRDTKRVQAGLAKVSALCIETEKVTYISNGVLK